jgi:two-component system chemotaxis response regulator CheB
VKTEAIVVGTSAGGLNALKVILERLPEDFPVPILIVQHLRADSESFWINNLNAQCKINVKEAVEKELIVKGNVYIAPPDYHMLVELDRSISLSQEGKVNYSRPSIDVLFDTAADVYQDKLIGLVLTGASKDGARGLRKIKRKGGTTVVENPATAEFSLMPAEAIRASKADYVLSLQEIADLLTSSLIK